ncbi:MAG: ATP-dependent sacrificial sulfur transferase LarE [Spirochaetes bacterium]|nr:ATP-dependent sacrificial sulfur transferase LarE [Spirochaetota bacterium]MBU1081515.1 ATP-dependent sacrificial sulfur transferase LarE [Spirochaetota bacterium]
MNLLDKEAALVSTLRGYGSVAVALSGGVDSSYLCAVAGAALGDSAIAITIASPLMPRNEGDDACRAAGLAGVRHIVLAEQGIPDAVAANPPDRCYHCKKLEMGAIAAAAAERGVLVVAEGSNLDDLSDYRPGRRATAELGVRSPLADSGLTKAEIRELSRIRGLPTWDKPAFACLASRIPYGERLEPAKLARVEAAEAYLRERGFRQFRVRSHGDTARIELAPEERGKLFDEGALDETSKRLKELGFAYVCMELEGYRMGSLNRVLDPERIMK